MNQPPLRVLHLNSLLNGGGTDDQCVKLASGLHRAGQTVWVAGPDGREYAKILRDLGVPFLATPLGGPLKCRFILSAANLIRHNEIQILHGHHGRDFWPTVLAARLSGRRPKVVLTRHLAKSPSSWFSRHFLLGQCDVLIAVSQFVAKVLREGVYEPNSPDPERRARPPLIGDYSKIYVSHGGIDTQQFKPFDASSQRRTWGLAPEHFAFAAIGSYDLPRGKGQREFLAAAARVCEQIPQARFLIVGRGNMKDILTADIERLGLKGRAWLTPYCRDMPEAMNALDCLVHAQVGTEAFGLVVLEAFACGKPVLASALDGIPEAFAIGECGKLLPPQDVPALANALLEQYRQGGFSMAARQTLHQRVACDYSLPARAKKMLVLYRKLLAE